MIIKKTTTFAELLADCPCFQLESTPMVTAMWLEARLAEKGILLEAVGPEVRYDKEQKEK